MKGKGCPCDRLTFLCAVVYMSSSSPNKEHVT